MRYHKVNIHARPIRKDLEATDGEIAMAAI